MSKDYSLHPLSLFKSNSLYFHYGMANYHKHNVAKAVIFVNHKLTYEADNGIFKVYNIAEAHKVAIKLIEEGYDTHVVVSQVSDNFNQAPIKL